MQPSIRQDIFNAAKHGRIDELKGLLQEHLPHAWHQPQEGLQDTRSDCSGFSNSDLLEFVDKASGFTPLIAAIYYHRKAAVELLLDYGADVHNPGQIIRQTPLRVAVCALNMDCELVELLVSRGASPFLEDPDGMTPLDDVIRLRQNRIGPMPYYLGAVLLSLRRRCPFRGHLELKIERMLGLSQTWRKFFCVLAPRERLPGMVTDLQLLIFSKNGFDPITRVWITNAANQQIPMKTANGKLCYQLGLCRKQVKRPTKLYTTGSARAGFQMYVRALSTDSSEALWLQRFVALAGTEPSLLKSESSETHSQNMLTASDDEIRAAAARSIAHKQRSQAVTGKLRSMSFSDSAHSSQQRQSPPSTKLVSGLSLNLPRNAAPHYTAENLDSSGLSPRQADGTPASADMFHVTSDSVIPPHLPLPQDAGVSHQQAHVGAMAQQSQQPQAPQHAEHGYVDRMEPVVEVNEDVFVHSSLQDVAAAAAAPDQSLVQPALAIPAKAPSPDFAPAGSQAASSSPNEEGPKPEVGVGEGDRTTIINTPWANGHAEGSFGADVAQRVPFVSVHDDLKAHWRARALQGEDTDGSEQDAADASRVSLDSTTQQQQQLKPQWDVPQTGLLPPWGKPYTLPQIHTPMYQSIPILPVNVSHAYSSHLNPSFEPTPHQPRQHPLPQHQSAAQEAPLPPSRHWGGPAHYTHTHTSSTLSAHQAFQHKQPQASSAAHTPFSAPLDPSPTPLQPSPSAVSADHTDEKTVPMRQAPAAGAIQVAGASSAAGASPAAGASQEARSISPVSPVSLSEDTGILQTTSPGSHAPMQTQAPAPRSLDTQSGYTDWSDLEGIRQRSIALDIPSAELLDSILEFANNVCGNHDDILASLPPETSVRLGQAFCAGTPGWQHHSQQVKAAPSHHRSQAGHRDHLGLSRASVSSVEPFSDDDDVTILDTTEVIKSSHVFDISNGTSRVQLPSPLEPAQASPSLTSLQSDGYSLVESGHLDSASDLIFEAAPSNSTSSEYHTPDSSGGSHTPQRAHNMVPPPDEQQRQSQHLYVVYDSDPHLLTTIPEHMHSEGSHSQQLSTGSSHLRFVEGDLIAQAPQQPFPGMHPDQFREMVDSIIASGEFQAAQNHMSGGAEQQNFIHNSLHNSLHNSGNMQPIWEDEEDMTRHDMPCRASIGGLATV